MSPSPSQPTCANCAAALTDQATICHACTANLAADLRAVPDLLAELDTTITRQARIATPNGKGNGDKPIPYDEPASKAAGEIRAVLFGWAKVLLEEDAATDEDWTWVDRAPAHWLGGRLAAVRMREWAGDLADELKRASAHGWACIDRPEERYYAGPCGNEIDLPDRAGTVDCGTVLWAKLDKPDVRCPGCLHVWGVVERREWLIRAAENVEAPATLIASVLTVMNRKRVSLTTVLRWITEAGIPDIGERDGAKLYRVRAVMDAMDSAADREPGTAVEVARWLLTRHGIDLGPAGKDRIRQWAVRYPDEVTRDGALYGRPGVLAVAQRLIPERRGSAA